MSAAFASGRRALAFCDRCGGKYDYTDLKFQVVNQVVTGLRVCPDCLDEDHPQLQLGKFPVYDPQALRYARPDLSLVASRSIVWGFNPVVGFGAATSLGTVTVTTS